ncbi:oocyte zinc finger protein XlCOF28-like isoform X2 [Topomyia yanbarensis]|uniref:oocyte zinc finger protein XlCOF28-like isoform X2 n=1 Tax=Topomyia yanbarensis TaxID=2498891 RepID=UPI00273BB187|nr:oocyte zinc finger protein XlCOF28-like isoform X2 [Topomyia yanbarensis]
MSPSEDPSSYCRLCFSVRNLVSLLSNTGEPDNIMLNLITQCTGIQIDTIDNHPASICWRCAVALEDFQLFRQRSLRHDTIIRKSCATKYEIKSVVKDEIICDEAADGPIINQPENENGLIESQALPATDLDPLEGESTADTGAVGDHEMTVKAISCHLCNKRCRTKAMLWIHFKHQHSDAGRPFQCTICPASFKRKNHLEGHIASHSGDMRYSCDQCGANYAKGKSLRIHRQQMHGLTAEPPTRKTGDITLSYGPFQCSYCSKSFKHRPSLNFHIKSHYDMLSFKCEFCNARFDNEIGKLIHKGKYHPAEVSKKPPSPKKMFECAFCERTFEQQNYLTQHTKYMHFRKIDQNNPVEDNSQNIEEEAEEPVTVKFEVEEDIPTQPKWE